MGGMAFSCGPTRTLGGLDLKRKAATPRMQALLDALADAVILGTGIYIAPSVANDLRSGEIGRAENFRFVKSPLPVFAIGDRVWLYPNTTYGIEARITDGPFTNRDATVYEVRDIDSDGRLIRAQDIAAFDENHNQKRAYRQGKAIQCRRKARGGFIPEWMDCVPDEVGAPIWSEHCEYRVKPDPYADVKAAFAAGKRIEARVKPGRYDPDTVHRWHYVENPIWTDRCEYRVQPESFEVGQRVMRVASTEDRQPAYSAVIEHVVHPALGARYMQLRSEAGGITAAPRKYVKPEPVITGFVQRVELFNGVSVFLEGECADGKVTNVTVKEFS